MSIITDLLSDALNTRKPSENYALAIKAVSVLSDKLADSELDEAADELMAHIIDADREKAA